MRDKNVHLHKTEDLHIRKILNFCLYACKMLELIIITLKHTLSKDKKNDINNAII
uniref:Uncharacterized protein n=1 Tax=Rhizophora mucronata TaxID=61149 RepID=A0A2P2PPE5_RHIMU